VVCPRRRRGSSRTERPLSCLVKGLSWSLFPNKHVSTDGPCLSCRFSGNASSSTKWKSKSSPCEPKTPTFANSCPLPHPPLLSLASPNRNPPLLPLRRLSLPLLPLPLQQSTPLFLSPSKPTLPISALSSTPPCRAKHPFKSSSPLFDSNESPLLLPRLAAFSLVLPLPLLWQ
jgi:hypothetical protein